MDRKFAQSRWEVHSMARLRAARRCANAARAFTLVEMLVTIAVVGVAAAMVLPMMSSNDSSRVASGAALVISDLDFAQATAINEPAETVLVRFDPRASRWWVALESTPDTPLTRTYSADPYDTTMGEGRAESAVGVTFSLTDATDDTIAYDAYGRLTQTANPVITLSCNGATATITIDAETGFLRAD